MEDDLKAHLATDLDLTKLKYPVILMPKIDGVRGLNIKNNRLTGRSNDEFANAWAVERFSGEHFQGIDGELALGSITSDSLCRDTTGFLNRKHAKADKPVVDESLCWHAFDYLAPHVLDKPYRERLEALEALVEAAQIPHLKSVVWHVVEDEETLLKWEQHYADQGYEGIIVRDPNGLHKSGRATVRSGAYLRRKPWIDFEVELTEIIEAMENTNEAKINSLGRSERSTHQDKMVPKGMLGAYNGRVLKDVVHNKKVLMPAGEIIKVGPGQMKHDERLDAWINQAKYIGKIATVKTMAHGVKDKLRMCNHKHFRIKEDM